MPRTNALPRSIAWLAPLVLGLAILGGCAANRQNFWHPGPIRLQQMRSSVHDPFPDPDLGPEIDGGRPRGFLQPLPEPVRNRFFADSHWLR